MVKPKTPAGGTKAAETTPETKPAESIETQTAATDPPETKEEKPAPTPEEIEAQAEEMQNTLFAPVNSAVNAKIKAEQEAEADKPKVEEEPTAEAEVIEETPAAPVEEPEPAATPAPEGDRFVPGAMTPEQVQATAREAAREEIESREPEPAPIVPHGTPADEALPYALKKHLTVLNEMAATNPAYRDLPQRQREFWKRDEQYRARWEQANPGAAYEPGSPDHAEFYRKNEPFVPEDAFDSAKDSLLARVAEERAVTRVRQEQEPRLREIEKRERKREVASEVHESRADAVEEIYASVPEFKDKFEPKKLSVEALKKMEEANPVLAEIAHEEAGRVSALVLELEMFDRMQGQHDANPQLQNILVSEFAECEAALLAKQEVRDGKKLIPYDKALARAQRIHADSRLRPDQKQSAIQDLNNQNWWVQPADVKKHIVAKSRARVERFAERFSKTAQPATKTTATNGVPSNGAQAANGKPATPSKPNGKAGLARGTSTASSSDAADNAPRGQSELEKRTDYLAQAAFP